MVNARHAIRISFVAILFAASLFCHAQDFTITIPNGLHTPAVDPGGTSTATIVLTPVGASGGPVALSCAVTAGSGVTNPPVCLVSPSSATPPAQPGLTITTSTLTPTGNYPIAITGTDASGTETLNVTLDVTDLTEDFTLSVSPTTATPSPVNAGASATSTVTVTPIGSYTGNVTLSCLSVTPVVTASPYCSFQYPGGNAFVSVGSGASATVPMTITTFGPFPTTRLRIPRLFYAFWILPGAFALVSRRRSPRLLGMFFLLTLTAALLLLPACNSTNNTNSPTGQSTPKNTYTFTLAGTDQNGAGPSNITTNPATVSLGVN